MRLFRRAAMVTALLLPLTSCQLLADVVGSTEVYESEVTPVDLDLPVPTYAVATRKGLVLRAGDARRLLKNVQEVEWLPGGRALVYAGKRVRIWDPADNTLGPLSGLGDADIELMTGELKRSVTQISVTLNQDYEDPDTTRLAAYSLDMEKKWVVELPGPDDEDPDAGSGSGFVRGYKQGHTIDGVTFLMWSDYDPNGEESDPHYGLLRVDEDGEVLDSVQVNERITSMWLSADGASLLALRRTSGHPCGGCQVTVELVELNPGTGDVVAEYGMPDGYDKSYDVVEVDKVGDRVAVRLETYPEFTEGSAPQRELGGTWMLDDDGWSLVEGSKDEISWWQGPDDRIIARLAPGRDAGAFQLSWEHEGDEQPIPGRLTIQTQRTYLVGSVPGYALPPE